MVDLTIVQENIQQALYNLANIDALVKEAQKALLCLSEERRKDLLYLAQKNQDEKTVIETFEDISYEISNHARWVFDEMAVTFKSFYQNHLTQDERTEFNFVQSTEELLGDALESKSEINLVNIVRKSDLEKDILIKSMLQILENFQFDQNCTLTNFQFEHGIPSSQPLSHRLRGCLQPR